MSSNIALVSLVLALAAPISAQSKTLEKEASVPKLIEQLGADSYRDRQAAERQLRELGKEALAELRKAAREHHDPEVAWRARRVVSKIEGGGRGKLREPDGDDEPRPGTWRGLGRDPIDDRLQEMIERMEKMLGRDSGVFFRQMEDLEPQLERMRARAGPVAGTSRGMSMRIGPDGVRLEITEKGEDGGPETKVYEAPDMASFREQYPDIARRHLDGESGAMRFRSPTLPDFAVFGLPRMWRTFGIVEPEPARTDVILPKGRRLGFAVGQLAPEVREYLGIDEGQGLLVDEVEDDTLAEALGIEKGDIIVEIDGITIYSPTDVGRALGRIEAGKKVEVKVIRRGRDLTLEAEKREGAEKLK